MRQIQFLRPPNVMHTPHSAGKSRRQNDTMSNSAERLAVIRREFPVLEKQAYLNTGTAGPLPRRVAEAIHRELERQLLNGRASVDHYIREYFPLRAELRAGFARLLGATADEIAITHHTTEGMNIAVWGLNWQRGDEIVTTTHEHEGALLPIYAAARRLGLTVRIVDVGVAEADIVGAITAALSQRTRLVVVSHVSYVTGAVLPIAEIAAETHRVGALLAVDGAQSAGTMPVNAQALGVDAYAVPGQKWLCGPEGVGALYVRSDRISELSPTYIGHFAVRDFEAVDRSGYFLPASGACRYEGGTVYWPILYGMYESLRWLEEAVGWEWIFARSRTMTQRCREVLADLPSVTVHSPAGHIGLTAFSVAGCEPEASAAALVQRGVVIRSLHHSEGLRVSTGFFTDDNELDRLRDGLLAILGGL
jgi:L-cysteine/cystine lyase